MYQRRGWAIVLLSVLLGCQAAREVEAPPTQDELRAVAAEVEARTLDANVLAEANDVEGSMLFYSSKVDSLFLGSPALFAHGTRLLPTGQDVRDLFASMAQSRGGTKFTLVESHVAPLSLTSALQVTVQHFSVIDTLGVAGPVYPVTATTLWIKEDGAWKIAHFHQSWTMTPVDSGGA